MGWTLLALLLSSTAAWGLVIRAGGPIVSLSYGQFQGSTSNGTDSFLGIPFAASVAGANRLTLPKAPPNYSGVQQATAYGPSCPSQTPVLNGVPSSVLDIIQSLPILQAASQTSEDCLSINVIRPAGTASNAKLPVLVWIYGGGFSLGSTSMYPGGPVVQRSVSSGQPVIYVSMNYRLAGWGFLPGQQIGQQGVGNLGLQDQRFALQWVHQYISLFGGDPGRVTIWGESAGAISVALQMLTNGGNTNGLFQAGYMNSGSPIPVGPIANGQAVFDTVAQNAGCGTAADPVQCLRTVSYATFRSAQDSVPGIFGYSSLHLAYLPRVDGVFLTDDPQILVQNGKYAHLPIVNGDCDDEGTLFTLPLLNITTNDEAINYFKTNYAPKATQDQINTVATLYPQDPAQGSPYNTGLLNAITPEFKRLASGQGDLVFQSPRRWFLNHTQATQPTWSYINRKLKATPILGSFHGSDLFQYYFGGAAAVGYTALDYLVNFANTYNPNGKNPSGNLIYWPQYNLNNFTLLQFADGVPGLSLVGDTFRVPQMAYLRQLSLLMPI